MPLTQTRIRPGPAAVAWLAARRREEQARDPLAPLTVVAPSQYAALHLRRSLAQDSFANVRFIVLDRLAEMLGAARLAREGRSPLSGATRAAIVRAAVRRAAPALQDAAEHLSLVEQLAALALELRRREPPARLPAPPGGTAAAALAACAAYSDLLEEHGLHDEVDLLAAATLAVREGEADDLLEDLGRIIVHLPPRLEPPEAALLAALDERTHVDVAVIELGSSPTTGDVPAADLPSGDVTGPAAGGLDPPASARREITIAADAVEETRTAVRHVLASLEETPPVPLHRTAILYRDRETYGGPVRDTLRAAGLPHAALDGRPLSESIAGRGLLGLLRLRETDFARPELLNWLSGMPHRRGHELNPVLWDRLSRSAGVVRGAGQWQERLHQLATDDREAAERAERAGDASEGWIAFRRRRAAQAEAIAGTVAELEASSTPPAEPTWPALVAWVQDLRRRFLSAEPEWPEDEREAAQMVDQVVQGLGAAAAIEPDARLSTFLAALEAALSSRHRPEGRLGDGVVIGPLDGTLGMSFDRVHILGMTERSFPHAPPADPFFGGEDPLHRRQDRLAAERQAYLAALAAAGGGLVRLSCPQTDAGGRPVYPSAWLVEEASRITGSPVAPSELRAPRRSIPGIGHLLGMPEQALPEAPAPLSLSERRCAEVIRWARDHDGDVATSPLARRTDAGLRRVLEALGGRRSRRLTAFDGNLASATGTSQRLAAGLSGQPVSASVIEGWAKCPFSHLMSRVLRVEPTERPEDDDDIVISALQRGNLVHRILELFYRRLRAEGRPAPGESFSDEEHGLIEEVAAEQFAAAERRGVTGNRLVWENVRDAIVRDLHTTLYEDDEHRQGGTLAPMYLEQGFGFGRGSWPPAVLRLHDGREVSLRGSIDRVDISADRTRARVIDYKTGSLDNERPTAENLLVGGRKVQLAVYAEAVRRWAEETGKPLTSVEAAYWFVSARGGFRELPLAHAPEITAALEEVLEDIDEGVRAGAFPQAPGAFNDHRASWENCRFCSFDRICPSGRDAVWERKSDDIASRLHTRLTLRAEAG